MHSYWRKCAEERQGIDIDHSHSETHLLYGLEQEIALSTNMSLRTLRTGITITAN